MMSQHLFSWYFLSLQPLQRHTGVINNDTAEKKRQFHQPPPLKKQQQKNSSIWSLAAKKSMLVSGVLRKMSWMALMIYEVIGQNRSLVGPQIVNPIPEESLKEFKQLICFSRSWVKGQAHYCPTVVDLEDAFSAIVAESLMFVVEGHRILMPFYTCRAKCNHRNFKDSRNNF